MHVPVVVMNDNFNRFLMIETSDRDIDDNNGRNLNTHDQYGNETLLFANKYFKDWNINIIKIYVRKCYSLCIGTNGIACTFGNLHKCHSIYYIIVIIIFSIFITHCIDVKIQRKCYNDSWYVKYAFYHILSLKYNKKYTQKY